MDNPWLSGLSMKALCVLFAGASSGVTPEKATLRFVIEKNPKRQIMKLKKTRAENESRPSNQFFFNFHVQSKYKLAHVWKIYGYLWIIQCVWGAKYKPGGGSRELLFFVRGVGVVIGSCVLDLDRAYETLTSSRECTRSVAHPSFDIGGSLCSVAA